uniref:Uncharacterized protein n=1 Tax=Acrobeloides nanus TaxID=290746 RepID=A0A914DYQ0_9BILA
MRDALAKAAPNVVYSTEWGIMYIPPGDQPYSYNPQNDWLWANEAPDTEGRVVERVQKAESVMVWVAISARGKTPLVFVDQGTRIDRHV